MDTESNGVPHRLKPHLFRLSLAGLLISYALIAAWLSPSYGSEQIVRLENAIHEGKIKAHFVGRESFQSYQQPMLDLTITNIYTDGLELAVHRGLVLTCEDPGYPDLVVGRENTVSLEVGESKLVPLYTFSLDPRTEWMFPAPTSVYHIQAVIQDQQIAKMLDRIAEQRVEDKFSTQLALWMQSTSTSFEQLEQELGVALTQYQTDTLQLVNGPQSSPAPGTPLIDTPTPVSPPETEGNGTKRMVIGAGAIGAVVLILAGAGIRRWMRDNGGTSERSEPAPICQACGLPLDECKCPLKPQKKRGGDRLILADSNGERHEYICTNGVGQLLSQVDLPFVFIRHKHVSAPHALLDLSRIPYTLKDLNSSNGTMVDGEVIDSRDQRREIKQGTKIRLGSVDIVVTQKQGKVILQSANGEQHRVRTGTKYILSRHHIPTLVVPVPGVSSPHALLRADKDGRGYVVKDLNSQHGTTVEVPHQTGFDFQPANAQNRPVLRPGRRLRLGSIELNLQRSNNGPEHEPNQTDSFGPYKVITRLGKGGMAEVYLARDQTGKKVVVKVPLDQFAYDGKFRKRFDLEAKSMKKIDHPNIVPILDVGEDRRGQRFVPGIGGIQYIVMEYIDGCSLDRLISRHRTLKPQIITEIVRGVAMALSAAHQEDIVHRDVKPGNILIDRQGQVYLTDFGIVRARWEAAITEPDQRPGAAHYMSPEQCRTGEVDNRSDIYSLGVVMYQMLAGRLPFNGSRSPEAVMTRHMNEQPVPLWEIRGNVDPLLAKVAMKCLSKDPDDRFQRAQDLLDVLEQLPNAVDELARAVDETCPPIR